MARVTIRFDLGAGASLGAVAGAVDDLSVVHDLGVRVDTIRARREAELTVERWWRESSGQLHERLGVLGEAASLRLRRLLAQRDQDEEFQEWYRARRPFGAKGREAAKSREPEFLLPPPFWFAGGETKFAEIAPDLFGRLAADEFTRRVPPISSVERLTYENPIELVLVGVATLLTGAGIKFGTFTELATLMRDWSADREAKRAQARESSAVADRAEVGVRKEQAEVERTQAETREIHARASKAEIEAEVLRRYALGGGEVEDLLGAGLAPRELQAIERLASGTLDVQVDEEGP